MDFCKIECQTRTNERKFGIYDAEDNTPAKISYGSAHSWNAKVINETCKNVLFTAIDNCIDIKRPNGDMDNRCDCMLTYDETLVLIELKNKRGSWQTEGLFQIQTTLERMVDSGNGFLDTFKKRRAFVVNRKHQFPSFQESNIEQREYFWKNYRTRIQFEATIIIEPNL